MSAKTVLFLHTTSEIGGGNKVLQRLMQGLDSDQFLPHAIVPTRGPLENELKEMHIPYSVIDTRSAQLSRLQVVWSTAQLFASRIAHGARILHSNELPYRIGSLAARGMKRICHVHHPGFEPRTLAWLFRVPPHLIITPSQFIGDEVRRCMNASHQQIPIRVLWNPIDTNWFRPAECIATLRRQLELDESRQHVSILGTLSPHKGHRCFLRMARFIADSRPDTDFHIVGAIKPGKEDYLVELKQMVEQFELGRRVHFWGSVDDLKARDILAASDLFVLPSEEEGFGLVLAEAQSCQVPVLATRMRPLDEVVDDGQTGFLVAQGDAEQYAAKALEILTDPNKQALMGRLGRSWVIDRFSIDQFTQTINRIYREIDS